MTSPTCTCPMTTDSSGAVVRAYLDANCPVHAQPAGVRHCPTCTCGQVPIVQTPEVAAQLTRAAGSEPPTSHNQ